MPKLDLYRYANNEETTIGILLFNGKFQCYVLEDEPRDEKVSGETRIPAGLYSLELRRHGGHHIKYATRFPEIHDGMVQIMGVEGFTDILIHCGNTDADTMGCLLVGNTVDNTNITRGFIGDSKGAYTNLYPKLRDAIQGEGLELEVHNENYFIIQGEY